MREPGITGYAINIFMARIGEKARSWGWGLVGVRWSRCVCGSLYGKKAAAGLGLWWVCDYSVLVALRPHVGSCSYAFKNQEYMVKLNFQHRKPTRVGEHTECIEARELGRTKATSRARSGKRGRLVKGRGFVNRRPRTFPWRTDGKETRR